MNCREFEQVWHRLLDHEPRSRRLDVDGDPAVRRDLKRRLREHAEGCEACRALGLEFETLRGALRAWSDRLSVSSARPEPSHRGRTWIAAASAVAAAIVAAVLIWPRESPTSSELVVEAPLVIDSDPVDHHDLLSAIVDDAAAASWRLAQLAAEPAARLGREMLGASFPSAGTEIEIEIEPLEIAFLDPAADSEFGSDSHAPGLLGGMGRYLSASVEPVSASAREAFGFLRSPMSQ